MAITLPQELFDNVIDHYHDDRATLKLCALVCRGWLSSCRTHIFHRVSLSPAVAQYSSKTTGKGTQCQRIFQLIKASPSVVPYIRELHICEGMARREWIASDPTLPPLLLSLTNLRRFELERSASMRITWHDLPDPLTHALTHIFALESLMELKLVGLVMREPEDLQNLLHKCRNLRTLEAHHVTFLEETALTDDDGVDLGIIKHPLEPKALLDVLVIGPRTSTALIRCLIHPASKIDVTSLRTLSVSISGNFSDFARLLRSTVSLEFLELVLMNDIDLDAYWTIPPHEQFDLSHNPYIKTLQVKIDVIQRQTDPLPWLSALFQTYTPSPSPSAYTYTQSLSSPTTTSTPTNALTSIWVVYTLYLPAPYMDRSVDTISTQFKGWREIDRVLAGPGYESLEGVQLDFMLENPIGFGVAPRFLREVDLESPFLLAGGLLSVDAYDTSG